jgi:uncharacterized protein YcgI (DUF1989 family)
MIAQFTLRARTAKALALRQGATLRIINTHGSQVVDTWAFCTDICDEFMSMEHTRVHAKSLMPNVGTVFRTNKRRPILKFITDTSAGQHDWFYAACDQQRYEILGFDGDHDNCSDNLRLAMSEFGRKISHVPCPLNLFENAPMQKGKNMEIKAPTSRAGDVVEFAALIDMVICLSACPQDMVVTNGADMTPKDVEVQILDGSGN